jgi:hypothetical protein
MWLIKAADYVQLFLMLYRSAISSPTLVIFVGPGITLGGANIHSSDCLALYFRLGG